MKCLITIVAAVSVAVIAGGCAVTVEQAKYKVINKDRKCEIRDYESHVLAETVVDTSLEDAGNVAFGRLFSYISGKNKSRSKIAMTAPVSQAAEPEKIEMTSPVVQQSAKGGWAVSFTMPASYTMETVPLPDDPAVKLRLVPACRMAAIRYSGTWSEKRYLRYLDELNKWIKEKGFTVLDKPVWARYNPPFTPWFLRRNEILIPVSIEKK